MSDRAFDLVRQLAKGAAVEPPDGLAPAELDELAKHIDSVRAQMEDLQRRIPMMSADEKRQALVDLRLLIATWRG